MKLILLYETYSLSSFKLCHVSLFNTYETPIEIGLMVLPLSKKNAIMGFESLKQAQV